MEVRLLSELTCGWSTEAFYAHLWAELSFQIGRKLALSRQSGGLLVPPLEMSAQNTSWLRVTAGLGKFFSPRVSTRQLTSCSADKEGGLRLRGLDWANASDWSHCQSWSFFLVVHFPPVCGTEFDLSLVLGSKKKSFLLMFAIRHMQCRGAGGGRRAVLAHTAVSWPHGGPCIFCLPFSHKIPWTVRQLQSFSN